MEMVLTMQHLWRLQQRASLFSGDVLLLRLVSGQRLKWDVRCRRQPPTPRNSHFLQNIPEAFANCPVVVFLFVGASISLSSSQELITELQLNFQAKRET